VIRLAAVIALAALAAGCATPYMVDRGRDAADIFTGTVGFGVGIQARASFIDFGLCAYMDNAGLRGGKTPRRST
jgi:hypothetical protein